MLRWVSMCTLPKELLALPIVTIIRIQLSFKSLKLDLSCPIFCKLPFFKTLKYIRLKQKESKWGINVEQLFHGGGVIWEGDNNLVLTILHCTHENYEPNSAQCA
jgi:hypothetical protein